MLSYTLNLNSNMTTSEYRKALDAAVDELESLLSEQERIEARVMSLRKTVYALSTLCQEAGEKIDWHDRASERLKEVLESSITDDILSVIYNATLPLTTTGVQHELEKIGTLENHKNPLATINAVLARLVQQGKIKETTTMGRKSWEKRIIAKVSLAPPPIKPVRG